MARSPAKRSLSAVAYVIEASQADKIRDFVSRSEFDVVATMVELEDGGRDEFVAALDLIQKGAAGVLLLPSLAIIQPSLLLFALKMLARRGAQLMSAADGEADSLRTVRRRHLLEKPRPTLTQYRLNGKPRPRPPEI